MTNCNTHSTPERASSDNNQLKGPHRALDIIRERFFDGKPKYCRLMEGRTRQARGHKRNAANSQILRIPYPDKYTQEHLSGALYILHMLLDIMHPPERSAKTKHKHTDLWHRAAEHIGVRQGLRFTDELIVIPNGKMANLLPEILEAMRDGEVYIPDWKTPHYRDIRYCEYCNQRMDIRNPRLSKLADCFLTDNQDGKGACTDCIIEMFQYHSPRELMAQYARSLPPFDDDGPIAELPSFEE